MRQTPEEQRNELLHIILASLAIIALYVALLSHLFASTLPHVSQQAIDKTKDGILAEPKVKEYRENGSREMYRFCVMIMVSQRTTLSLAI